MFILDTYKLLEPAIFVDAMWENISIVIADLPEDLLTHNEWLHEHTTSPPTVMIDHDYLFEYFLATIAYDYTPSKIRTVIIHPVHGITPIFGINNYSKEI